tara:strand:+ start:467 stop:1882 length:1416 start_codon:yes stop_codon:yes gene_type:complete
MNINQVKNICCIGAGYVGGPTMTVIANYWHNIKVNVVDINQERINAWNDKDLNNLPIYEPGLDILIKKTRGKNLFFSTDVESSIASADIIFLSVNTPTKTKGFGAGQASDLRWIEISARQIAKYAKGYTIVVEKSTLPVKTAETIQQILNAELTSSIYTTESKSFSVLSNPEFLAEGTAITDLEKPDRLLIGGDDANAIKTLEDLYKAWIPHEKILKTNLWSSELSKLTANAFLAQRISSINSISALCEATGADIKEVARAVGSDRRIGDKFLNSGPGFGGSCFKKDILNLVYLCNYYGLHEVANYWESVVTLNSWQQHRISSLIVNKLFRTLSGKRIAIFGFAFKSNTNDTRESPAVSICKDLLEEGANLAIYDPKVNKRQIEVNLNLQSSRNIANDNISQIKKFEAIEDCVEGADAIVILTEWDEFKIVNWEKISKLMRKPSWIFDARGILNQKSAIKAGFKVWSVGKG